MRTFSFFISAVCFFSVVSFANQQPDDLFLVSPQNAAIDSLIKKYFNTWYYPRLGIKPLAKLPSKGKPIVIAVVDDGFNLNHRLIAPFLYKNPAESPDNNFDDDKNGYVDDLSGWDISDNDNNTSYPKGREDVFFHGSYVVGVITAILYQTYGIHAPEYFKILPVKVLSNNAKKTFLADGFKGITYAASMADIVCCAWSGGRATEKERETIKAFSQKGKIFISSAGNMASFKPQEPASYPEFIAIASVDSACVKTKLSNYNDFITVSAFGENVAGAATFSDSLRILGENTSAATAIASALAAVIKSHHPGLHSDELREVLKNSAIPVDSLNPRYAGRLGAGLINLENALDYSFSTPGTQFHNPLLPTGVLVFTSAEKSKTLRISPRGGYKGFYISKFKQLGKSGKSRLFIFNENDSLITTFILDSLNAPVFLQANQLKVNFENKKASKDFQLKLNYSTANIDSATLYCSATSYTSGSSGTIEDGSKTHDYASGCDCKWIISVPEGKRIRLSFPEFNTQPNEDYVYLFDGDMAMQENVLAVFSGSNTPPVIVSRTNQVLIWFVSDNQSNAKGWKLEYKAVDDKPGLVGGN